jgi:hypothetical protein
VEVRVTVTVARHGLDAESGEKFLHGFITTHPEVGPVVDQNTETGEMSVTYSFEADDFSTAAKLGSEVFEDGANASGLEPTELINADFSVVDEHELADEDVRELQPA